MEDCLVTKEYARANELGRFLYVSSAAVRYDTPVIGELRRTR